MSDNKDTEDLSKRNPEENVAPNLVDNQNSTPTDESKSPPSQESDYIKKLRKNLNKAKEGENNSKKETNPLWEGAARFASIGAKFELLKGQIIEYIINLFNTGDNSKENKYSGKAAPEEMLGDQGNSKKIKEDASKHENAINNQVEGREALKDIVAEDKNSLEKITKDATKISDSTDNVDETPIKPSNLENSNLASGYVLEGIVTKKDENSLVENTGNEEVKKSYQLSNLEDSKVEISEGLESTTEVEGALEDKGEVFFPAEKNSAADVAEVLPELKNAGYSNVNLMSVNNTNHPLKSLEDTEENKPTILEEDNKNDNQNDNNTSHSI